MIRWYVVSTRPHQEARAIENLRRQDFTAWLPTFRKSRRHARRFDSVLAPLFPGYLFVQLDAASQPWRSINGTIGVRQILLQGQGQPAPLPDAFVAALLERRDADGLVHADGSQMVPGEPVRVIGGAMVGCVGQLIRLDSRQRVTILLQALGSAVSVTLPLSAITSAA